METILKKVAVGYIRLFPELLNRFYEKNDQTIVNLIADNVAPKLENNFIDLNELKKNVVDLLNNNIKNTAIN